MSVATQENDEEDRGGDAADDVRDGGRADQSVTVEEAVQNEHQGNIEDALAEQGEHQRFLHVSRRLEERDDGVRPRREGSADAKDAEEGGAVAVREVVGGDEDPDQLPREEQSRPHAEKRYDERGRRREPDDPAHPGTVARGVVVTDQGKHALRHPAHHAVRQHIDLFRDADTRLRGGAVSRHQLFEHGVGDVLAQGHQASGNPDRNDVARDPAAEHSRPRLDRQDQTPAVRQNEDGVVDQRDDVRDHRGERRAEHFVSAREDHEHKDRVERDVAKTADHDAETRLERAPLRTDQVGEQGIGRGDDAPRRDGDQEVFPRQRMNVRVAAAEQVDEPIDEQKRAERVDGGGEHASPERERRSHPRLVAFAAAEQTGNHACAADPEQVGDSRQEHERRHTDGHRRDLRVRAGQPDEVGVRHIINNKDDLSEHRRQGKRHDRPDDTKYWYGWAIDIS